MPHRGRDGGRGRVTAAITRCLLPPRPPAGGTPLAEPYVPAGRRGSGMVHGRTCAREGTRRERFGQYQLRCELWEAKAVSPPAWHNGKRLGCLPPTKVIVNLAMDAAGKRKSECSGPVPFFGLCGGCQLVQLCLGFFPFNIAICSARQGFCSEPNGSVAFNSHWINPRK